MDRGIRRIAVVNRGEAAMRLINAVRELRYESVGESPGQPGGAYADLRVIALHTRAERTAMFVREADEAVCLDDDRAADAGSPYLDLAALERALVAARADAAWVGWGFVAERPEFAELCDRLGVVFIGPSADVMRTLGDKIEAKHLAERSGVPVAPWSGGPVESIDEARRARRGDRLPADDQGDRGRRRSRHPQGGRRGGSRRGVHECPRRRAESVRRRHGLHGTSGDRRASRRGADHRRWSRHRLGGGSARLHDATAQPEGHRGVALRGAHRRTGSRPACGGRPAGGRRRVRERRHGGIPVPAGRSGRSRSSR